jgi:plastocyanin
MAGLHRSRRTLPGRWKARGPWLGVCLAVAASALSAQTQVPPVTVQVEIVHRAPGVQTSSASENSGPRANASNVAVWLDPLSGPIPPPAAASKGHPAPQLVQRNKTFSPHVLVVQAGTMVQFPNEDPFFHNVFSLYAGKRFDLGLYEAGSSRSVLFEHPGASFLFCNIHPEMSAVVVVVPTPYFGLSDATGRITIAGVPDGKYRLQVWYERSSPENLKSLDQIVTISAATRSLRPIRILANPNLTLTHKNKYGQDYVPASTSSAY